MPIRTQDMLSAIDLHRPRTQFFRDALIVTAAQVSGCRVLLSEDMQHGRRIGDVRIENPFL